MKLYEIAHSRAGDKGSDLNISVIAFNPDDWPKLESELTTERISKYLGLQQNVEVNRYVLPKVYALNFVIRGILKGGVTRSLALDSHGKSLSSIILDLEI